MRLSTPANLKQYKPVLAGLLAALMLLLTLASASSWLHERLHSSRSHTQSPCAVCILVEGQLNAPLVTVSEVFASLSVAWTLPAPQIVVPAAMDPSVVSTRGPPASVSSQS